MSPAEKGACRYCKVQLVDWDKMRTRSLNDLDQKFRALQSEMIRHHFWHKDIDEAALLHARRKGLDRLREAATTRLQNSVGPAQPPRDGQQTPMQGNILYYAQHATASCCRTCMEYWHGIPKGRSLSDDEVEYFVELAIRYVAMRMPLLPAAPEKIPRRRYAKPRGSF
ncbi:MAG: DUF4186 family protein [Burkholderiales bacterium]|nr:DUF4186 family protein [Burkholderiales bacterium]